MRQDENQFKPRIWLELDVGLRVGLMVRHLE